MIGIHAALVAGHFVGDFVLQSDWMATNKSKRWDALALLERRTDWASEGRGPQRW